jgi:hypothetical protein
VLLISVKEIPGIYKGWDRTWYRQEVRFSDWRNVGNVDYSTNAIVSYFYTGKCPKYLRQENFKSFIEDIEKDTVTVGVDYYGNFPISRLFLPEAIFTRYNFERWYIDSWVMRLKFWKDGNIIRYKEY